MTQAVAQIRHTVARTGFANPLTLGVTVEDVDYLEVYADDELLQVGVDYVVLGIGDTNGVEIEIIGAEDPDNYVGFETFTALYAPTLQQGADLSLGGNFGRAFESALDQMNRRLQALAERVDRSLKMPVDSEGSPTVPRVPAAAIVWNDDGDGFLALPVNLDTFGTIAAMQGEQGDPGADGIGVPIGGASGAFLVKASATNYATAWQTIADTKTALGISAFAQTLLDDANGAAMQTTLGISAFAQTILDDASAAAARTTLGALGGALGATDNRLLRADGTGGVTAQGSAVTVDDSGYITAFGGRIAFPATQSPSSDPNTLDDYEEGTWTPVLIGLSTAGTGTYSTQLGSYTKIGERVMFEFTATWSAHTGTGDMRFNGLPFTSNASGDSTLNFTVANLTISALPFGRVAAATTAVILEVYGNNVARVGIAIDSAATIGGSGHYRV